MSLLILGSLVVGASASSNPTEVSMDGERRCLSPPPTVLSNRADYTACGAGISIGDPVLLNDEPLMAEFTTLFSPSPLDVLHCDFPTLLQYIDRHAIKHESWTHQDMRSLIAFHLAMGMCAFGKGIACKAVAAKHNQSHLMDRFIEVIVALRERGVITSDVMRFISNAVGLRVPVGHSVHDCVQFLVSAHGVLQAQHVATFDLIHFLTTIHRCSRHVLLHWCSGHGIYCKSFWTLPVLKQTVIRHIVRMDCCSAEFSCHDPCSSFIGDGPSFCEDVGMQIRPSLPDADRTAFLLSLACLDPDVHASTLRFILDITTGHSYPDGSVFLLRDVLRAHIYSLRMGKSVYQSVLRGLLKNNRRITELNRAANLWPHLAEQTLQDKVKVLFEEQIIANSTFSLTCTSCSIHYTSRAFSRVPLCELDLAILEIPDGWAHVRTDSAPDGPLANLLLNNKGVFHGANDAIELSLCKDCHCALEKPRMPKFALANFLCPGSVPDVLRDLTAVEESMVALCRARCIMVQLKAMCGSFNAQRAFRGHTIFHLQNPSNIATKLPPSIDEILAPISVLFVGATKPSMKWIRAHLKPLVVRAPVV